LPAVAAQPEVADALAGHSLVAAALADRPANSRTALATLIAAHEVQPYALGEDVDAQLTLGAEDQIRWQAHGQGSHRVIDVLGRAPFPRADQRVRGAFPHKRQVHA
jgi:hypothetical protein